MIGIPENILKRMREVLVRCGKFQSDEVLRATFIDQRISHWRNDLPIANTVVDRVNITIDFLKDQKSSVDENALALFLRVLSDSIMPQNACHRELAEIAAIYEYILQYPEQKNKHQVDRVYVERKSADDSQSLSSYILSGYPDFSGSIKTATRISILASSLSSIAMRYYSNLEQYLQKGGSLRVIVSDTTKEILLLQTYRAVSLHDPQEIKELIERHITIVKQLSQKAQQPDSFQLRLMPYLPPFSITIMEFPNGKSEAYVKLLAFQKTEYEQPTFVFHNQFDKEWFEYFLDQFERFWNAPNRKIV